MKGEALLKDRLFWLAAAGLLLMLCGDLYNSFGFLVFAAGGLLALLAWILLTRRLCRSEKPALRRTFFILRCATDVLLVLGLALFLLVEGRIIRHGTGTAEPDARTLIVLGAGLQGAEPSATLHSRLTVALDYLQEHPESVAVVTGGQGERELRTEASAMFEWLTERGIAPERIYLEEQARDTRENLIFSRTIVEREGLPQPVAVVSNSFHLFRAEILAEQAGFEAVQTLAAPVPVAWLIPSVYLREFVSVMLMTIRTLM